jgi:excisionase family DNA binding protein
VKVGVSGDVGDVEVKTYLSAKQVAKVLNVCVATVLTYIKEGRIPARRLKRAYRIDADDLRDYLRTGD